MNYANSPSKPLLSLSALKVADITKCNQTFAVATTSWIVLSSYETVLSQMFYFIPLFDWLVQYFIVLSYIMVIKDHLHLLCSYVHHSVVKKFCCTFFREIN